MARASKEVAARGRPNRRYSLISFVLFLVAWELAARAGLLNPLFFGSPLGVVEAGLAEIQIARFWSDMRISAVEFGAGYLFAVVLGIPLGLVTGWYRRPSYIVKPWLDAINAVPRISLLPLIILWVGLGIWSKIVVVFLGAFFSIMMNTFHGVRVVSSEYLNVARAFAATEPRKFRTVVLPASAPFIVAGLRLGIGRALIGVIFGELFGANAGIGFMMKLAARNLQTNRLLFGVLIFTVAGLMAFFALRGVENRLQRWRASPG